MNTDGGMTVMSNSFSILLLFRLKNCPLVSDGTCPSFKIYEVTPIISSRDVQESELPISSGSWMYILWLSTTTIKICNHSNYCTSQMRPPESAKNHCWPIIYCWLILTTLLLGKYICLGENSWPKVLNALHSFLS